MFGSIAAASVLGTDIDPRLVRVQNPTARRRASAL